MDNIKSVELNTPTKEKQEQGALTVFNITWHDDTVTQAPADPTNRFYRDVKEWHEAQKKAPFKFDFEDLG